MTLALFCPLWARNGGIFSPDPVTMETGYIGHGKVLHPNSRALGLDQPIVAVVVVFYDQASTECDEAMMMMMMMNRRSLV